jgi:phosphohistidine phosphatase
VKVLMVRHAIAANRDPSQWPDDRQRPLTAGGERKMRLAARGLAELVGSVDLVLSSPWVRAWQTAEILHQAAGWPAPTECQELEGDRSPRGVLSVLKELTGSGTIVLVGHEPQTHSAASYLLTGDSARVMLEFKKAAVAMLDVPEPAAAGTAVLLWLLPPRVLRALH